ncbi:MAG: agmatine deiminase family protein [Phycisphaerales bacterium]
MRTLESCSTPVLLLTLAALSTGASAQVLSPSGLVYPEGSVVPRYATDLEKALMAEAPGAWVERGPYTMPQGPLTCPGEYAPADGIILAWEGGTTLNNIQAQMIKWITTTGNARAYVSFDTLSEQTSQLPVIQAAGADMAKVFPIIRTTDAIWMRDYGPRYSYEGNVRVTSDHTYNVTVRVNDDSFPVGWAPFKKHARYVLPMVHGGGNYHLNSLGEGFATMLIANENPARTQPQIISLWQDHWGPTTTIVPAYPTSVDLTQHIDMWVQIIDDRKVLISDWPNNPGTTQDSICDNRAATMQADGWEVFRVPARSIFVAAAGYNVHYTYTNLVMCNELVLVPTYTNSQVVQHNAESLAVFQSAFPTKTVVQIPCESLVQLAGVMHCIVMHVPKHLGDEGGLAPTAYLRAPNGGQSLTPGTPSTINWISDDDNAVVNVDLQYSADDGGSWTTIASAIPDSGTFSWTVPNVFSTSARVRVITRDAEGRTGHDDSDAAFTILGTNPCVADFDDGTGSGTPDGGVTIDDLLYYIAYFNLGAIRTDIDDGSGTGTPDGGVTIDDLLYFLARFNQGC